MREYFKISSLLAALTVGVMGCLDFDDSHYAFSPAAQRDGGGQVKTDGGLNGDVCTVTCAPPKPVCRDSEWLTTSLVRACSGTEC